MTNFFLYLTIILFILVCLFLILLILIQKGRGGGLSSAFGGAGGHTAFGSKTGDVLTWATSIVFGVFLLLAVALNLLANARPAPSVPVVPVVSPVDPLPGPLPPPPAADVPVPPSGTPELPDIEVGPTQPEFSVPAEPPPAIPENVQTIPDAAPVPPETSPERPAAPAQ